MREYFGACYTFMSEHFGGVTFLPRNTSIIPEISNAMSVIHINNRQRVSLAPNKHTVINK